LDDVTRPLRTRLAALAAAALFLLSGAGDLLGAHPCAHHEGIGHEAPAADAEHAHGHEHDTHEAPAEPDHEGEPCSCPGTCASAAGMALPGAPTVAFTAPAVAHAVPAPADAARLPGRLLPHVLPYALAPPRAA
jgi:hypothetical protein